MSSEDSRTSVLIKHSELSIIRTFVWVSVQLMTKSNGVAVRDALVPVSETQVDGMYWILPH